MLYGSREALTAGITKVSTSVEPVRCAVLASPARIGWLELLDEGENAFRVYAVT